MPRGDGTGPAGFGPMTGRAAGFCAGYNTPGYMSAGGGWGRGGGFGRGFGRGYGRGMGLGFRGGRAWGAPAYGAPYAPAYPAGPTPQQEREALQGQAEYLEDALDGIRQRLTELEKANQKTD